MKHRAALVTYGLVSVYATAQLLGLSATAWGQGIQLSDVATMAGQQGTFTATLSTGGAQVAGTQNDVTFSLPYVTVAAGPNGAPDCAVNPTINKGNTTFTFQPPGCAATGTCTGLRAIVYSQLNTNPIADGSVLYTCTVQVAAAAPDAVYALAINGTILASPAGTVVCGQAAGHSPCTADHNASVAVSGVGPTPTSTLPPTGAGVVFSAITAAAGDVVQIAATLRTGGAQVAGLQNDLGFSLPNVTVAVGALEAPDCTVNPTISKNDTAFDFQPPGCELTGTCTGLRALVFSRSNIDPIADGSVLYTCNVLIAAAAPAGVYPLPVSGTILSDPAGGRVCGPQAGDPPCTANRSGSVTIGGVGPTRTPTPTLPPAGPGIVVSSVTAAPGQSVKITATLRTGGAQVGGVQNDLGFSPPDVIVAAKPGRSPDCTVNPAINKGDSTFSFQPIGCAATGTCAGIRAIVVSFRPTVTPIVDGSVLYTCTMGVAAAAPAGVYPLPLSLTILGSTTGTRVCGSGAADPPCTANRDGAVVVGTAPATPTETATLPATVSPSPTPTPTPSATPTPTPLRAVSGRIVFYRGDRPVPGVEVTVTGPTTLTTTTDATGAYTVSGLAAGSWVIRPTKLGGRNTGVSALDASYVLQEVTGTRTFSDEQTLACDATGNGGISALDANRILQLVVGASTRLPAATLCGSDWLFIPDPSAPGAPILTQPLLGGGACDPGAIAHDPLDSALSGQTFHAVLLGDCTGNWSRPTRGVASRIDDDGAGEAVCEGRARELSTGRLRYTLRLHGDTPTYSVEATLRYDPNAWTPRSDTGLAAAGWAAAAAARGPDRVAYAGASGVGLAPGSRVAVVDLEPVRGGHKPVPALVRCTINGRPARWW